VQPSIEAPEALVWPLHAQTGLGVQPDRFAELRHVNVLGFIDKEDRPGRDDGQKAEQRGQSDPPPESGADRSAPAIGPRAAALSIVDVLVDVLVAVLV
jgi:hypothetical protein